jgi:arylsulfatase A-like enzyme
LYTWIMVGLASIVLAGILIAVWPRRTRPATSAPMGQSTRRATVPAASSRRGFLVSLGGLVAMAAVAGSSYLARRWPSERTLAASSAPASTDDATPSPSPVWARADPTVLPAPADTPVPLVVTTPKSTPVPAPSARPTIAQPTAVPRQPNVLLITIDTLRADRLGAYGFANAHTPNLDRLAAEGVRFSRAICQLPQTNASHAALFTGLYASTSGVRVHMVDKLRPGTQTLASVLAANGYRTAGIFSWVSLDAQFCGLDQGFQSYQGFVTNRNGVFANQHLEGLAAIYRELKEKAPIVKTVDVVIGQSDNYEATMDGRADVTTASTLAWLDGHDDLDPFFLWVHYYDPHYPYAPPAGYDRLLGLDYDGAIDGSLDTMHQIQAGKLAVDGADRDRLLELYQGEIAFADAQIGRFLDILAERGLLDSTVIVVAADHGESFGEGGDWAHGTRLRQSEVHVPLLARYPARIPAGRVVDPAVQLIDVMPTVLDLVGLTTPKPVQGTSLLPLITGQDDGSERYAFVQLWDESKVSLVYQDWELIRSKAGGELQLYNLREDPTEQNNLAQSEQVARAADLNTRLVDLMKIAGIGR